MPDLSDLPRRQPCHDWDIFYHISPYEDPLTIDLYDRYYNSGIQWPKFVQDIMKFISHQSTILNAVRASSSAKYNKWLTELKEKEEEIKLLFEAKIYYHERRESDYKEAWLKFCEENKASKEDIDTFYLRLEGLEQNVLKNRRMAEEFWTKNKVYFDLKTASSILGQAINDRKLTLNYIHDSSNAFKKNSKSKGKSTDSINSTENDPNPQDLDDTKKMVHPSLSLNPSPTILNSVLAQLNEHISDNNDFMINFNSSNQDDHDNKSDDQEDKSNNHKNKNGEHKNGENHKNKNNDRKNERDNYKNINNIDLSNNDSNTGTGTEDNNNRGSTVIDKNNEKEKGGDDNNLSSFKNINILDTNNTYNASPPLPNNQYNQNTTQDTLNRLDFNESNYTKESMDNDSNIITNNNNIIINHSNNYNNNDNDISIRSSYQTISNNDNDVSIHTSYQAISNNDNNVSIRSSYQAISNNDNNVSIRSSYQAINSNDNDASIRSSYQAINNNDNDASIRSSYQAISNNKNNISIRSSYQAVSNNDNDVSICSYYQTINNKNDDVTIRSSYQTVSNNDNDVSIRSSYRAIHNNENDVSIRSSYQINNNNDNDASIRSSYQTINNNDNDASIRSSYQTINNNDNDASIRSSYQAISNNENYYNNNNTNRIDNNENYHINNKYNKYDRNIINNSSNHNYGNTNLGTSTENKGGDYIHHIPLPPLDEIKLSTYNNNGNYNNNSNNNNRDTDTSYSHDYHYQNSLSQYSLNQSQNNDTPSNYNSSAFNIPKDLEFSDSVLEDNSQVRPNNDQSSSEISTPKVRNLITFNESPVNKYQMDNTYNHQKEKTYYDYSDTKMENRAAIPSINITPKRSSSIISNSESLDDYQPPYKRIHHNQNYTSSYYFNPVKPLPSPSSSSRSSQEYISYNNDSEDTSYDYMKEKKNLSNSFNNSSYHEPLEPSAFYD